MREIKFKCWDVEARKMYPVAFPSWNGMIDTRDGDYTQPNIFLSENGPEHQGILLQSTVLLDKNGKGIYEGDIIRISPEVESVEVVEWVDPSNWLDEKCPVNGWVNHESIYKEKPEIIGNIYENPELLTPPKE